MSDFLQGIHNINPQFPFKENPKLKVNSFKIKRYHINPWSDTGQGDKNLFL